MYFTVEGGLKEATFLMSDDDDGEPLLDSEDDEEFIIYDAFVL